MLGVLSARGLDFQGYDDDAVDEWGVLSGFGETINGGPKP